MGDRVLATAFAGATRRTPCCRPRAWCPCRRRLSSARPPPSSRHCATMLFALTRRTSVAAGEWVAVLGAGGGIGLATVDVAKALGARVVACASSDEKLAAARAAGADATVAYEAEGVDLKVAIRDATGGGADVLVDPVGGPKAEAALRALGWMGRYVVIGFAAGEILAYRRTRCCSTTAPSSASTGGPGPSASRGQCRPHRRPAHHGRGRRPPSGRTGLLPARAGGRRPRRPRVAAGHRQGRTGPVAPRLPAGGRQLGEAVEAGGPRRRGFGRRSKTISVQPRDW